MSKHFVAFIAFLVAGALAVACSRKAEDARPVATPTAGLSRTDVAVGTPLDITYRFAVAPDAPPLTEDYLVFVHFLDSDRERMWDDDHEPPVPTTQWKPGSLIEYSRTMFVPKFPYVGATTMELGLYSRTSGERLPLAGEDSGMRAYRVATFNMSLRNDSIFVIFKDGWHETEVADDGSQEWQWSKKQGTISFKNPKADVILMLELDQPVTAVDPPQRVEIRFGDTAVDTFSLPPTIRELRRVALSQAQLGTSENVEVAITVDRTFVPSAIPALRSSDPRELGVRVFRAYVEPK